MIGALYAPMVATGDERMRRGNRGGLCISIISRPADTAGCQRRDEMRMHYRIEHDDDATSPRGDDNLWKLACWHRRYTLGDVQPRVDPMQYLREIDHPAIILPLYLYDHSGITISTGLFGDPWDSGQVGYAFVSLDDLRKEYGVQRVTRRVRALAQSALEAEVCAYAQYLEGDCWGYIVETDSGEDIDSCWGFLGRDYCEEQARESLAYWQTQDAEGIGRALFI